MAKELIAFLNFEFRQSLVNIKSVSGETLAEVPRFVINWRDYQALLASLGLKHDVQERPLFRRYLSYLSSADLYNDLISFQAEMRGALTEVIRSKTVPEAVWKRVFKDTNGLPMFIEPEGEGDWTLESAAAMSFHYDFSADTYRLFVLAMVRGLILNRRLFSLTVDAGGKFQLPEKFDEPAKAPEPSLPAAAAPTEAELRSALRAAVARELPAALAKAVSEKLPLALAESAAEKLPVVMDALVKAQLPETLARAVDERVGAALAEAVELNLPEALKLALLEKLPSELPDELARAVEARLPDELAKAVEARLPEALEAALRERLAEIPVTPPPAAVCEDSPEEGVPEAPAALAPDLDDGEAGGASEPSFAAPSFSISVPGTRHIRANFSISVPAPPQPRAEAEEAEEDFIFPEELEAAVEPGNDFVFLSEQPQEIEEPEELEEIEPEPLAPQEPDGASEVLESPDEAAEEPVSFSMPAADETSIQGGDLPDIDPTEYAGTFREEMVEEGLALFDAPGPAREEEEGAVLPLPFESLEAGRPDEHMEPEEEELEEIEPAEELLSVDGDEPLVLSERVEPEEEEAAEASETPSDGAGADDTIVPIGLAEGEKEADEKVEDGEEDDGWLPFLKVPSKKKGGKVPLERRLATLEQRKKRRPEHDGEDRFDF